MKAKGRTVALITMLVVLFIAGLWMGGQPASDDTLAALDAAWEEAPVMFSDAQPPADAGPATALKQVQP